MCLAAPLLAAGPAVALPVLSGGRDVEGVRVYPDSAARGKLYYGPGRLVIPTDASGQPEISFLQMIYMGASVTGDQGEFRARSVLSFKVQMEAPSGRELGAVRAKLREEGSAVSRLVPLPIRKVEAVLNYCPLVDAGEGAGTAEEGLSGEREVGRGALEDVRDSVRTGAYWSERMFTITPDDLTSQALWDAFQTGKVMLSLSYSFFAEGAEPAQEGSGASGEPALEPTEERAQGPEVVLADTVSVTVDATQYPERFKRIDINQGVPANYAALSIYCYDFNDELRPDLYAKIVEIEARSVTGAALKEEAVFSRSSPDVYSATVRFQFAVSLKDPYRYRIHEISTSGEEAMTPWRDGKPWSQQLDVTTPPEEQPEHGEDAEPGDEP